MRLSRVERWVLVLAGLLALAPALELPVLRTVWPRLAVEVALHQDDPVDPWGERWRYDFKLGFDRLLHSTGPNRVDEDGAGDDVSSIDGFNPGLDPSTTDLSTSALVLDLAGWLFGWRHLLALGLLLGWLVAAPRLWVRPRGRLVVEVALAAVLACPVLAVGCGLVLLIRGAPALSPGLVVSPALASGLTIGALGWGAALGRRLTRAPHELSREAELGTERVDPPSRS